MKLKSCQDGSSIYFYRDDDLVIKVDKQKLFKKSGYFRAMYKTCYKDHKSDFIDVNFPEKEEIFIKVMQLIVSDSITLDINSIFETYHLAVYFQMNCLQQFCLDHFTLNLNRITLGSQLDMIEKRPCLFDEFEKRASTFGKSGNISFSGLYFLQESREGTTRLKIKSKHFNSPHVLEEFTSLTNFGPLHRVGRTLCSMASAGHVRLLFQYDVLSGKSSRSVIDSAKYVDADRMSICADKEVLYLFNEVEDMSENFNLNLSLLRREENAGCFEVCKTKRFSLPKAKDDMFMDDIFTLSWWGFRTRIHFSHCYEGKLYVFYHMPGKLESTYFFHSLYLLVICGKTFRVLKNQKLSDQDVRLDCDLEKVEMWSFEKLFYSEKCQKLFIKADCLNFDKHVLVFDMKRDFFYFYKDFYYLEGAKFAASRGGRVHAISRYRSEVCVLSLRTEVRVFKFNENERLVGDTRIAWRSAEPGSDGRVLSACFV